MELTELIRVTRQHLRTLEKTHQKIEEEKRTPFEDSQAECYGLIHETCPVLRKILEELLPEDKFKGAEGVRGEIFTQIHDRITMKFRAALEIACQDKHALLDAVDSSIERFTKIQKSVTRFPAPVVEVEVSDGEDDNEAVEEADEPSPRRFPLRPTATAVRSRR